MPRPDRPLRVLLAAPGSGDSAEVTPLARALRDAGMEVIYAGLGQTPEALATAALQEGVDVVCLCAGATGDASRVAQVVELLRDAGAGDRLVVCAGPAPEAETSDLRARSAAGGFIMANEPAEIVTSIEAWSSGRAAASA